MITYRRVGDKYSDAEGANSDKILLRHILTRILAKIRAEEISWCIELLNMRDSTQFLFIKSLFKTYIYV